MTSTTDDPSSVPDADSSTREQDKRLGSLAIEQLRASGYPILRRLRCDVVDGVVILGGRVPSFHLKQMAQVVLAKVESIGRVKNMIEVG
jgi:hypothetical protein